MKKNVTLLQKIHKNQEINYIMEQKHIQSAIRRLINSSVFLAASAARIEGFLTSFVTTAKPGDQMSSSKRFSLLVNHPKRKYLVEQFIKKYKNINLTNQ